MTGLVLKIRVFAANIIKQKMQFLAGMGIILQQTLKNHYMLLTNIHRHNLLLLATLLIAISGLVYELLAGTLSSYLLGDSVYQFSLVIGLFMTAMGLGAYLSRFIQSELERAFVIIQIMLGLSGGLSALILFYAFTYLHNYGVFLFLISVLIGTLMGLEIPLITRILDRHQALKINISNVLSADYLGALIAALLFPLVLVPQLGLLSSGLLFGMINLLVAGLAIWLFQQQLAWQRLTAWLIACLLLLGIVLWHSQQILSFFEQRLYQNEVIFAHSSPYQRIILTRKNKRIRLYLNGNLQFDSLDEYRYHEALVHPMMGLLRRKENILVLGGGDGMAVREVLKHEGVKKIVLVDLDPVITDLFRNKPLLAALNHQALHDKRVEIINMDAWKYIEDTEETFDGIILDLPDPHNLSLSKLYSRAFYSMLNQHLNRDGLLVTQATSPFYARQAFWCIHNTLAATPSVLAWTEKLNTQAYHSYVPSFGEWGFVLAAHQKIHWENIQLPAGLSYLERANLANLRVFAPDMGALETHINTLQTHPLLMYYEKGWGLWFN